MFLVLLATSVVAAAWPLPPTSRVFGWQALPLLAAYLGLGIVALASAPDPKIDVYVFQRDASAALLAGGNPYALTFPNIYENDAFYGPGVVDGGRVRYGFPYPPLSLLLVVPAWALAGDPRLAQLVALVGAAALVARLRPGRTGALAAAVLLLSPRSLFVLTQAWTEPFAILLLALLVLARERRPRLAPLAAGLLFVIKQYVVILLPLARFLAPRDRRDTLRFAAQGVAAGALVSVPIALWSPGDFWRSAVLWQLVQPPRYDALSYSALLMRVGVDLPVIVPFVAAGALALVAVRRLPEGGTPFAAGAALVLWGFFVFSKQAFCNYYFLVIGAAVLAALGPAPGVRNASSIST
jgi:hypothetical protein